MVNIQSLHRDGNQRLFTLWFSRETLLFVLSISRWLKKQMPIMSCESGKGTHPLFLLGIVLYASSLLSNNHTCHFVANIALILIIDTYQYCKFLQCTCTYVYMIYIQLYIIIDNNNLSNYPDLPEICTWGYYITCLYIDIYNSHYMHTSMWYLACFWFSTKGRLVRLPRGRNQPKPQQPKPRCQPKDVCSGEKKTFDHPFLKAVKSKGIQPQMVETFRLRIYNKLPRSITNN